jgi:hypothetical protein
LSAIRRAGWRKRKVAAVGDNLIAKRLQLSPGGDMKISMRKEKNAGISV